MSIQALFTGHGTVYNSVKEVRAIRGHSYIVYVYFHTYTHNTYVNAGYLTHTHIHMWRVSGVTELTLWPKPSGVA
jgi:hypothetical protein